MGACKFYEGCGLMRASVVRGDAHDGPRCQQWSGSRCGGNSYIVRLPRPYQVRGGWASSQEGDGADGALACFPRVVGSCEPTGT